MTITLDTSTDTMSVSLTVTLPEQVTPTPGERVLITHYMERTLNAFKRTFLTKVYTWEERKAILRRLTEHEAALLGLQRDWKRAATESTTILKKEKR